MEWNNWPKQLPLIIQKQNHNKAIQILDLFYKNNSLNDPLILINQQNKILNDIKFISHIKYIYNLIISYIKSNKLNPDFNTILSMIYQSQYSHKIFLFTTKYQYKSHYVNLLPIHPYAFGIFQNIQQNQWVNICKNSNIPTTICIEWNQHIFNKLRIRISKESNFYLDIKTNNLKYNIIREYGHLIYNFEQNSNNPHIQNISLKTNIDEKYKEVVGIISISYSPISDTYDHNNSIQYIQTLQNLIKQISNVQNNIYDDYKINQLNIQEYKEHFDKKFDILQQITNN